MMLFLMQRLPRSFLLAHQLPKSKKGLEKKNSYPCHAVHRITALAYLLTYLYPTFSTPQQVT